jgi:spore coat protein U-like protein
MASLIPYQNLACAMLIERAIIFFNGGKEMQKSRLVLAAVTAGALAMATNSLLAALSPISPQTANLPISANIQARCTVSATSVDFGNIDPTVDSDQTGTITVQCTKGSTATISLNEGAGPAGRQMAGPGGDTLTYELYRDAGRTLIWGTGNGGLAVTQLYGSSAPIDFTVYGRIPSGQVNAGVGSYNDIVKKTIGLLGVPLARKKTLGHSGRPVCFLI